MDATFLSLEISQQPMHAIALGLLRAGTDGPLTLEDLRRHLATRLDQLPAFRWRVVPVPLGLANPVFVEDPRFDLRDHLRHAVLPEPGGPDKLGAAFARLASQRLDRDRPLWRITLIDGLADGRQAIVLEIHHALMDGFALRTAFARIFSREEPAALLPPWQPGRVPGRVRLVAGALTFDARALARLPELVGRTKRATVAVRKRRAVAAVKVPEAGVDTPPSAINQGFTAERRFAWTSLPLDNVLTVKDVAGVTVNDVVLAIVGGALRGYLQARGVLPHRPLVANVPVGLDGREAIPRTAGNRFSSLTTSLATDVADTWERLHTISAVTAEAKACLDLAGRDLLVDWLECLPARLVVLMMERGHVSRRHSGKRGTNLDVNVVVSNLRGPPVPWQLGSTVVEELYLAGPPNRGVGVTFVVWDYAGRLLFGILSLADSVEDPEELSVRLSRSLEELVAAAEPPRLHTLRLGDGE
ncbi:MAG: wax ester/triacylglycerol synthase family O-acyltransferase [Actinomycetota bacterium]|nr:wax ester/triacylglycerol synthase family O-acyltransferase [Actinomycetota bacterium]